MNGDAICLRGKSDHGKRKSTNAEISSEIQSRPMVAQPNHWADNEERIAIVVTCTVVAMRVEKAYNCQRGIMAKRAGGGKQVGRNRKFRLNLVAGNGDKEEKYEKRNHHDLWIENLMNGFEFFMEIVSN